MNVSEVILLGFYKAVIVCFWEWGQFTGVTFELKS